MMQFDDLPPLAIAPDADPATAKPMPVPNPYHRFWFSGDFRAAQAPQEMPFKPSSAPLIGVFTPSSEANATNIGVGMLETIECFRFDFQGLRVGCEGSEDRCTVTITGGRWNGTHDAATGSTSLDVRPCSNGEGCLLSSQIIRSSESALFTNLTSITLAAEVDGEARQLWTDDVQMAWTDSSCDAAVCRSEVRNSIMRRSGLPTVVPGAGRYLRFGARPALAAEM